VHPKSPLEELARLAASDLGVFSTRDTDRLKISRKQLRTMRRVGIAELVLPGVYRMTAVEPSNAQRLRAALKWGGHDAAAAGQSAGETYGLEGVLTPVPEIVVPRARRARHVGDVIVHRTVNPAALMIREHRGIRVTGVEATLLSLASLLGDEAFEVACEDARRRRLTSVPALYAYLDRFGASGRDGVRPLRALLQELDPVHPSRSTLEVKTRRLLVAAGITHFTREFPLAWNGRTYYFDFGSHLSASFSRRTVGVGTTIHATTSTTTKSGVSRHVMVTG
jgi:hypothetical protein